MRKFMVWDEVEVTGSLWSWPILRRAGNLLSDICPDELRNTTETMVRVAGPMTFLPSIPSIIISQYEGKDKYENLKLFSCNNISCLSALQSPCGELQLYNTVVMLKKVLLGLS
jgi:hypothetical protein